MTSEAPAGRPRALSREDISQAVAHLKKTTTKEMEGISEEDVQKVAKGYAEKNGSFEALAEQFCISLELLKLANPKDGEEFARALLIGRYTSDKDAEAQANFRGVLASQLRRKSLRPSTTKEQVGPMEGDLNAAAQIYANHGGKAEDLAKHCGISLELLQAKPPQDGKDFAQKLLMGLYMQEEGEAAKAKLRNVLKEEIYQASGQLKVTRTRTFTGPTEEELTSMARLYAEMSDVEQLAERLGVSASALKGSPPKDAEDFARKVLEGAYTADKSESAKKDLRSKLATDLRDRKTNLRKAATRRPSFLTEEDLSGVGKVYADKDGDLEAIAAASGIELRLLQWDPPQDSTDFAQKLLRGTYTVDMAEEAKGRLRSCIRGEIRDAAKSLKKTQTKTWDGEASVQEVELFSKKYQEVDGDLAKLAEAFSLSLPLLEATKPASAEDFAKKLLLGIYAPEALAVAARDVRQEIKLKFQEGTMPKLKKTETKEAMGVPNPGQVALLAKMYTEKHGNLQQLALTFGADFEELTRTPPKDANDFALKLMRGVYSNKETQFARERLNSYVLKELQQGRVLKEAPRTRSDSTIKREEIEHAAALFTKQEGNLAKISAELNLDLALLKKDSPTEAEAFAEKLWAGVYVA